MKITSETLVMVQWKTVQIQTRVTVVQRKGERCEDVLMGLGSQQEPQSGMEENDRQGPECLQPRCLREFSKENQLGQLHFLQPQDWNGLEAGLFSMPFSISMLLIFPSGPLSSFSTQTKSALGY